MSERFFQPDLAADGVPGGGGARRGFEITRLEKRNHKEFARWPDGLTREVLPIDGRLSEILAEMEEHQVVIVQAETGAGKTTRIPQAILLTQPDTGVYMTQTRRIAVSMNGDRIAGEMGEDPGGVVGWRLRGEEPVISDKTRLTLVIDQTLVNKIRTEGKLPDGVLIIDEAHERSISTDLLLGLIKQYLPDSPRTKILITSATIDTEKFRKYFDGSDVVSVKGRMYPVDVEPYRLGKFEHHTSGASDAALKVMQKFQTGELSIPPEAADGQRKTVTNGSVAVLLPGKEDIQNVIAVLERERSRLKIENVIEIIECHGESPRSVQQQLKRPARPGTLRFVVATEVIRSSITVGDLVGVIDSLQIKRLITDEKGVAHLDKIAVSMAEADQAKGRAGRTQPGFYIPISFGHEYEGLSTWPQPAMLREPIASVVLQVASIGLNARTFPFIDRPDEKNITTAIERLIKLGALDEKEEITQLGETILRFPLDPERARALITAEQLGVLPETIIVTAVLENENIAFVPGRRTKSMSVPAERAQAIIAEKDDKWFTDRGGAYRKKEAADVDLDKDLPSWIRRRHDGMYIVTLSEYDYERNSYKLAQAEAVRVWGKFAGETKSDFAACVNAYRAYMEKKFEFRDREKSERQKKFKPGEKRFSAEEALRDWCMDNFLNFKRLEMVERAIGQIREDIASSPLRLNERVSAARDYPVENLTKALTSGLVDNVHHKDKEGRKIVYVGYLTQGFYGLEISRNSVCKGGDVELILVGGVRKVTVEGRKGGVSEFLVADLAAPVKPEWLMEVMPQLCVPKLNLSTISFDRETGIVRATEEVFYGGAKIGQRQVQVTGEIGVGKFVDYLMNGATGLPAEKVNAVYSKEFYDLGARIGKYFDLSDRMRAWYKERLGDVCTVEDAQKLDLILTDEKMSKILGVDYAGFRAYVKRFRPDSWVVKDQDFPLKYEANGPVKMVVPEEQLYMVEFTSLPAWEGHKLSIEVIIDGDKYDVVSMLATDLQKLRVSVEERRQYRAWRRFYDRMGFGNEQIKFSVKYQGSLPEMPQAEVWDVRTGQKAYAAPTLNYEYKGASSGQVAHTEWLIQWHKTAEDAEQAWVTARERLGKFDSAEYERLNFDTLKAQAAEMAAEADGLLAQIDLQDYKRYGLTILEANPSYGYDQSLTRRVVQAREYAGLTSYTAQPTKAVAAYTALKARLQQAQEYFAKNAHSEAAARDAAAVSRRLIEKVVVPDFGWPDGLNKKVEEMDEALKSSDFLGALTLAEQAKELIKPYEERKARRDRGEILLEVKVPLHSTGNSRALELAWAIAADGTLIESVGDEGEARYGDLSPNVLVVSHWKSNYKYQYQERWTVHHAPKELTEAQKQALVEIEREAHEYFVGRGTGWNVKVTGDVKFATPHSRDFRDDEKTAHDDMEREMYEGKLDVTRWESEPDGDTRVVLPQRIRNPQEKLLQKVQLEVDAIDEEMAWLDHDRVEAVVAYEKAQEEYLARLDETPGAAPIRAGTIFEVSEFKVVEPEPGKKLLQTDVIGDGASKTNIILVLDFSDKNSKSVKPGKQQTLVRVRAISKDQIHLFLGKRRDKANNKLDVTGYLVQVIPSPESFAAKAADAKKRFDAAMTKLKDLKKQMGIE